MIATLVINHTPWRPERERSLDAMRAELDDGLQKNPISFFINDADYRGTDWQDSKVKWALDQWRWSLETSKVATHHVFMTDDLHLMPGFWKALEAMVEAKPEKIIGLLSNHPRGPDLAAKGHHWYRTNSWLVGPAYVMPRAHLEKFLAWFEKLPDGRRPGCKGYANDDSSINQWISWFGPRETWHPLPTIIEHRVDLESTVGHGDRHSRERVSWRALRSVKDLSAWQPGAFEWIEEIGDNDARADAMRTKEFWTCDGPMMPVGE